jgi:hypothetical protein
LPIAEHMQFAGMEYFKIMKSVMTEIRTTETDVAINAGYKPTITARQIIILHFVAILKYILFRIKANVKSFVIMDNLLNIA